MPDDPLEDVKRRLQDQSLIIQRLQFEFETHVKEVQPFIDAVRKYVMDPVDGLVVNHRHLKRDVMVLDESLKGVLLALDGYDKLDGRLEILEQAAKDRKETKRLLWREGVVIGLIGAALSLLVLYLASKVVP